MRCKAVKPKAEYDRINGKIQRYCPQCRESASRRKGERRCSVCKEPLSTKNQTCNPCRRELRRQRAEAEGRQIRNPARSRCDRIATEKRRNVLKAELLDQARRHPVVGETVDLSMDQYRRWLYAHDESHRQDVVEKSRRYYANHTHRERARVRRYKYANPDKVAASSDRRWAAASSQNDGTVSTEAITRMLNDATACPYCGSGYHNDKNIDHMVPLSKGGPHSIHNLIVCCQSCNLRKQAKDFDEWLRLLPQSRAISLAREYRRRFGDPSQQVLTLCY